MSLQLIENFDFFIKKYLVGLRALIGVQIRLNMRSSQVAIHALPLIRGLLGVLIAAPICSASTDYLISTLNGGGLRNGNANYACGHGSAMSTSLGGGTGLAISTQGDLYVADSHQQAICRIGPDGKVALIATRVAVTDFAVQVSTAITVDRNGVVYFVDRINPVGIKGAPPKPPSRIGKVQINGSISTVLETYASGLALDPSSGNVVFATANAVYRLNQNGDQTVIAGGRSGFSGDGGPATAAAFAGIQGLSFDSAGNLYIADSGNNRVRRVTASKVDTVAVLPDAPSAIAADGTGHIYVTTKAGVLQVLPSGESTIIAGGGNIDVDGGPARQVVLATLGGIAADSLGHIYVSDDSGVRVLTPSPTNNAGCLYNVDASPLYQFANGGMLEVTVSVSDPQCSWLASNPNSWISLAGNPVSTGNGVVVATISPNPASTGRYGHIWIGGKELVIAQEGSSPSICALDVNPKRISFSSDAASGTFAIGTNRDDCTWAVSSPANWIFLTGTTAGSGKGSVSFKVGQNSGTLRTALITGAGLSVEITQAATGVSLPAITSTGVLNAATFVPGPISPNEVLSIFGQVFGPPGGLSTHTLLTKLGGVQVTFNDIPGYVVYADSAQVNVLVPSAAFTSGTSPINVQLESQGLVSSPLFLPQSASSPGLYTLDGSGKGLAVVVNSDGSLNSDVNGALRGSILQVWATGIGRTNPPVADGMQPALNTYPSPIESLSLLIDGRPAQLDFAGLTYAGILQLNARIPDGVKSGRVEVILQLGVTKSPVGVTISVQ